MSFFRVMIVVLMMGAGLLMTGCSGGYVLQGKAIRGDYSSVSFVHHEDSRLLEPGVVDVKVYLIRDPSSLGRELVAMASSDDRGNFILSVNTFGAGWMVEQWMVHTYRVGSQTAESIITLPDRKSNLKMLITLGPGVAVMPKLPNELLRQYEQYK